MFLGKYEVLWGASDWNTRDQTCCPVSRRHVTEGDTVFGFSTAELQSKPDNLVDSNHCWAQNLESLHLLKMWISTMPGSLLLGLWRLSIYHRRDFLPLVFHGKTWEQQQWQKSTDTRGKDKQTKKKLCQQIRWSPLDFEGLFSCFFLVKLWFFIIHASIYFCSWIHFFLTISQGNDCATELLINAGRGNAGGGGVMRVNRGQTAPVPWPLLPHSSSGLRFAFLQHAIF